MASEVFSHLGISAVVVAVSRVLRIRIFLLAGYSVETRENIYLRKNVERRCFACQMMRIEKCKYTWSLREPENGQFEYAWMDRFIGAMQKARIQVILDAPPTVFRPGWRISILRYWASLLVQRS